MSFGASSGENSATGAIHGSGIPMLGQGSGNLQSGANFFNTLLNGNQANTTAALQPNINDLRQRMEGTVQGASTLMPRGGGRFATLFNSPFQTNQQVGDLFNGTRGAAAGNLANIGGMQAQLGTTNSQNLFNDAFQQRQYQNSMIGSTIGAGLSLAATPFGGSSQSLFQRI